MAENKDTKKDQSRNEQVSRIITVLRLLENNPRGFTIPQLHSRIAEDFNVVERSIRRDIEALRGVGYDIITIENPDLAERSQVFKLNPTIKVTQQLVLSPGELLALYLAQNMLSPLKDTAFYGDLNNFFKKIDLLIREKDREHLQEVAEEIHFEPGPRWGLGIQPDTVDTIRSACANSQILKIQYNSVNSKTHSERKVGPQFLYFAKGSLYLVAEDFKDHKVKVFSVPRITSAEMTEEEYQGSKVDPENYFNGSFGVYQAQDALSIKLHFLPDAAAFVRERKWHSTQRVVNKSDGSIEMNLEVGLTPDLVQWVLGFGDNVEVLEPEQLKSKIVSSAERVIKKYSVKKKSAA